MEFVYRLGEKFDLIGGGTPSTAKKDYWGSGVPWVSSADIDASGQVSIRREVTEQGIQNSTTNKVPEGTIVVVTRVGLGKVAKLPMDMCFSQDIQALSPKNASLSYDQSFLMYQLLHIMSYQRYSGRGTTISGISKKQLSDLKIYLPPREEQERIVNRIEEMFSELDKAVESLQTIRKQLEAYQQAVLKEAFEGKFTSGVSPIYKTLNEFIEKPRYGTSKKCTHEKKENSTLVIRIPNIDTNLGIITYHDVKYAIFDFKELETLDLQEGDLLVIRSNGSVSLVGRTAYVRDIDQGNTFAGYLIRLRIKDRKRLSPKYLQLYLSSFKARVYFEGVAKSTSGVNNINAQEISNISLPYIGITQQELIIKEIESRLSVCDYIEQMVDSAIEQADALRKSILKQAFEGRLTK